MSGIEVAGLLLGAFPLCISAMEHYEDMRRAAGTFLHIRRQHGKDYRRIRLCQTQFTLTMRQLLQPLLDGTVVDQDEHDQLLAEPGGKRWQEARISAALSERLAEGGRDFIDALQDMLDTMTELGEQIYVNDPAFQVLLKAKEAGAGKSGGHTTRQIDGRASGANIAFQTRRLKYAITGARRDALLDDVDKQNQLLRDIVDSNDRLTSLSKDRYSRVILPKPYKATLQFWTHAERIFRLLNDAWNCGCKTQHCADLWLKHRATGLVDFQMHLKYCQGPHDASKPWTTRAIKINPNERNYPNIPPSVVPDSVDPVGKKKSTRFNLPWRDKNNGKNGPSIVVSAPEHVSKTATTLPLAPPPMPVAASLCKAIASHAAGADDAIILLAERAEDVSYSVNSAVDLPPRSTSVSLAEVLKLSGAAKLSRVHRFGIALTLASSHLQLHSTPWLGEHWHCDYVHLPMDVKNGRCISLGEPYLQKQFAAPQSGQSLTSKPDRTFVSLGIVLLELCFGQRFEECDFWSQPGYAQLQADPNMRLAMACRWLEDVEGDAGVDYARAVEWILRQAPVAVKDNKWRQDFAENVVQPLARNYELLCGTTTSI